MCRPVKPSTYAPIPMQPGPVTLHPDVYPALYRDYGSDISDPDFLPFYKATCAKLARLMGTDDDVVLMTGEGMLALWAALKSCLKSGDNVLTVGTGVFGDGMADMAQALGCNVTKLSLPYDSTIGQADSLERIEAAVRASKPVMITAVHCETPSGTLNPLDGLGEIKKRLGVPLLCVDAVASLGGALLDAKAWNIDILMGGSQKCLAAPPDMCFLSVSPTAWDFAEKVQYQGYESILPFRSIDEVGYCPYTANWHGIAALNAGAEAILREGTEAVFKRHLAASAQCREGLAALGIKTFPAAGAVNSPTVTAALVPDGVAWPEWYQALRQRGLVAAGSFGPMSGKVFRLGHMGPQANPALLGQALAAIQDALP